MVKNKTSKTQVLALVRDFLKLNDTRNQRKLKDNEVDHWFKLKQSLEEKLFSKPPSKEDKRKFIRVQNLNLDARYESSIEQSEGHIKEVSEGGFFVATPEPLPPGSEGNVTIHLPEFLNMTEVEITLPARVVYTNTGSSLSDRSFEGMGMAITEKIKDSVNSKWRKIVNQFLESAVDLEY